MQFINQGNNALLSTLFQEINDLWNIQWGIHGRQFVDFFPPGFANGEFWRMESRLLDVDKVDVTNWYKVRKNVFSKKAIDMGFQ